MAEILPVDRLEVLVLVDNITDSLSTNPRFTACSHAGLINVLNHARSSFPDVPLYGVMGGLHLSGITEKIIPQTIAVLKTFGLKFLAPGHCTGWRAMHAMAQVFGDELVPSAVGKKYLL